jgi:hypothetical protein
MDDNDWTAHPGTFRLTRFIMPPMKNIAIRISRSGCDGSLLIVLSMWRSRSFLV